MAESVLDVIAEDPKIEHVAEDMEDPAMHKHGGEYGEYGVYGLGRFKRNNVVRNSAVRIDNALAVNICNELKQENNNIQPYQPDSDKGKSIGRIVVFIGEHIISAYISP